IGVLATDLLVGVGIGILTKFGIHMLRGVRPNNLFKIHFVIEEKDFQTVVVSIVGAAIFSNFMSLKTALANLENGKIVIFQLNNAYLIDHTVMEFIHDFQHSYEGQGGQCRFYGMEYHDTFSEHPLAARRMKPNHMSRRKSDHYGV
ncbi:MAG TPA: SulP family inorganic anion transporter, partial [Methylobacter sp.]